MQQATLSGLVKLAGFREQRQHLFPSKSSLDWFVRQNRGHLVEAGALLMHTGQWFVDPERFDECVVEVAQKAAKRHLELA